MSDGDEDDIDMFCEAVLEIDESYSCMTANNGEDAILKLRQLKASLPNCIFLDLNMPIMDGKTFLQELKKDHNLKHIPVIIYTTSSDSLEKKESLKLGATYFLTKAATFGNILKSIKEGLKAIYRNEKNR